MMVKKVPEVNTIEEYNKEYRKAIRKEKPVILIDNTDECPKLYYDFTDLVYYLSIDAQKLVEKLMNQHVDEYKISKSKTYKNKGIFLSAGPNIGTVDPIDIKNCRILANQIYEVLMDKKNWTEDSCLKNFI